MHHLLIKICFQDSLQRDWRFLFQCQGIAIPDSVMSIGQRAFQGCSSLESADIPDSVRVPNKTFPVAPSASTPLQAKSLLQSLHLVGGGSTARFPRSMGKTCGFLALCFGCRAPASSKRRLMLYAAGPGPLAPWMLSPNRFDLENILRNRRFWRNANDQQSQCGNKYAIVRTMYALYWLKACYSKCI